MKKTIATVLATALFCVAGVAAADERHEIVIDLSDVDNALKHAGAELHRVMRVLKDADIDVDVDENRAYLGVAIEGEGTKGETGVKVLAVTPGGPADKAGMQSGDVITAINGQTLTGDETASAAKKLLAEMAKVKVGDEVKVDFLRGDASQTAKVVTDRLTKHAVMSLPIPGMSGWERPHHGEAGHGDDDHFFAHHGPRALQGLELAPLNAKLGEYFGTDHGVLVLDAPADIALEAGDVILRIGERSPKNAEHAYRILASYEKGEKAEVTVVRKKKETTVSLQW